MKPSEGIFLVKSFGILLLEVIVCCTYLGYEGRTEQSYFEFR